MLRLVSSACPWPAWRFKRTVFGVSHLTCPLWLLRTRAQGCGQVELHGGDQSGWPEAFRQSLGQEVELHDLPTSGILRNSTLRTFVPQLLGPDSLHWRSQLHPDFPK